MSGIRHQSPTSRHYKNTHVIIRVTRRPSQNNNTLNQAHETKNNKTTTVLWPTSGVTSPVRKIHTPSRCMRETLTKANPGTSFYLKSSRCLPRIYLTQESPASTKDTENNRQHKPHKCYHKAKMKYYILIVLFVCVCASKNIFTPV